MFYRCPVVRGSADDKTCAYTISITDSGLMADVMFVFNAEHGASSSYYTYSAWFGNLTDSHLFRFPDKFLDALNYLGLYKYALPIDTNLISQALTSHQCALMDC